MPDYVALQGVVGGAAPSNQTACKDAVTAQSTRSPLVVLFVVQGDEDHIHIGHSATAFSTDLLDPVCPFNNHVIVLAGSDLATSVPYALPAAAFTRMADNRSHTSAHLAGPHCHAAAPQVIRTGPHGARTADTDDCRMRPIFVVPPQWSEAIVQDNLSGRCALPPFFPSYIAPGLANPDADVQARTVFVKQWWRQACTNTAGGNNFCLDHAICSPTRRRPIAPQPTCCSRERSDAHRRRSGRTRPHHCRLPSWDS